MTAREQTRGTVLSVLVFACATALAATTASGQTFFAQPQSHLGRLVQSITSPLVLSAAGTYGGDDQGDAQDESPLAPADQQQQQQQPRAEDSHYQHYRAQQPSAGHERGPTTRYQQQQALQQAPSQQRGVSPQHYLSSEEEGDEAAGYGPAPQSLGRPLRGNGGEQQPAGAQQQEYQMGAYLGPTIDDKEIQGAFNSNNDERDEDDGPAGYVGPPTGSLGGADGRQRANTVASGARSLPNYGLHQSGYVPSSGTAPNGGNAQRESSYASYDDSGDSSAADEDADDALAPQARRPNGSGLNQAASQYYNRQQQQRRQPRARTNQQLATAANGYAPYGPIDLSGLMAAGNGNQLAGYDVYNGDGSYAGGFDGYAGAQQGGRGGGGGGRRQQAASMGNQFGYGPMMGGYAPNQQQQQRGGDDDADADADED